MKQILLAFSNRDVWSEANIPDIFLHLVLILSVSFFKPLSYGEVNKAHRHKDTHTTYIWICDKFPVHSCPLNSITRFWLAWGYSKNLLPIVLCSRTKPKIMWLQGELLNCTTMPGQKTLYSDFAKTLHQFLSFLYLLCSPILNYCSTTSPIAISANTLQSIHAIAQTSTTWEHWIIAWQPHEFRGSNFNLCS